ncbi:conserved exported hypothetical protein [Paraburkholderia piptadeniae]|uniref:DUF2844 domain-containing protein n=1 Tax=Paraburkholderia piptadeniae TaxID=1701573 RepID=A0A1N7S6F3_9BURK|nr:DUF2844 domain-containing protein [Paraburkholderia piptadeniae]SIT42907.1 conserved exported hypothetical protein [Paraburkholderia piptadeniae]
MTRIENHRTTIFAAFTVLAAGVSALLAGPAHAELGGTISAPRADDGSTQRVLPGSAVQIRSTVDASGTTINEYATSDGLIFAYAWQGPTMPDLTRMLGRYAAPYRAKAAAQLSEFSHLHASRVEQPEVIVESGGQMRSYVGRAWLPAAVPSGISLADLR